MLNDTIKIGTHTLQNRVVLQPMEACDCENGAPSALTTRKYMRFAESGAGLIWFEANGVCPEGLTNPGQMQLTEQNTDRFKQLLDDMKEQALKVTGIEPKTILQLTHSGRQSMERLTMYDNKVYAHRSGQIVTDDYLEQLPEHYAASTLLAEKAGFDGVDIKACHGYLLMEALSAFNRPGKYGGSFENRTRLYLNCLQASKAVKSSGTLLTARIGLSDMVAKPNGFGTDEKGNLDLTEPLAFVDILEQQGLELLNVTLGNPYHNPHVNRPYKVGTYTPPESAETGLNRFITVCKAVKAQNPKLPVVMSAMSFYRENMLQKGDELLQQGVCDLIGYGRASIACPTFYEDWKKGTFNAKKQCVLCGKCTQLMRAGQVSGCAVHDPLYREIYRGIQK